jgi:predicted deacylase
LLPEPRNGTLRLLTLAALRLPDLAMIAQLMHIDAAADNPVVLCAAHDVAGGALRLARRALETQGRDLGYDVDAWIEDALLFTTAELAREHDETPVLIDQMRHATLALTHAIGATADDRMLVPEALSESIRHLFVSST